MAEHRYQPMLPTKSRIIPKGDEWRFELKFDGWRMLAYIEQGEVRLVSRHGKIHTEGFGDIVKALGQTFPKTQCVVDGELISKDVKGHPSLLRMKQKRGPFTYYIFDLLEENGVPLVNKPLVERRRRLKELYRKGKPGSQILLSEFFSDGQALFQEVINRRLEGIVAKRAQSPYLPGKRSLHWLKIKPKR